MRLLKENSYILYYAVLFILLAARTSLSPSSALIRLVYLFSFFLPLLLKYSYLYTTFEVYPSLNMEESMPFAI